MRKLFRGQAFLIACTYREGEEWDHFSRPVWLNVEELPFLLGNADKEGCVKLPTFDFPSFDGLEIHALLFEHGHVWDCINGWRVSAIDEEEQEELYLTECAYLGVTNPDPYVPL